jgi:hypothetical protein
MIAAIWLVLGVVTSTAAEAPAGVREDQPPATLLTTSGAAADGLFLPSTLPASVGSTAAFGSGLGGYDGARGRPIVSMTAEVRVWGPVALRTDVNYSDSNVAMRPSVGLRAQLLRQERHGIDGSLSVFYKPEGFTEPEGEIETFASVARTFNRTMIVGNLVYGQDPEGRERDGEVRTAVLYRVPGQRWTLGAESRVRFAIGNQQVAASKGEPKFDLLAGPVVTVVVGPLALFSEAGPSFVQLAEQFHGGLAALAGLGAAF